MPELPEVEVCRRNLNRWTGGRTLRDVTLLDPACIRSSASTRPSNGHPDAHAIAEAWKGHPATSASRHGKRIGWGFGPHGLVIHLGMTGNWHRSESAPRHARIGLHLDGGSLWFTDTRRFGCLWPVPAAAVPEELQRGHGPDALNDPPTAEQLAGAFQTRSAIKVALLDQQRLAGIGNIQAAEALWRARIHPAHPSRELGRPQWERLSKALVAALQDTIDAEDGDTITYINDGGHNPFSVYGRSQCPCPRCQTAIASFKQSGRVTYFCPTCQTS